MMFNSLFKRGRQIFALLCKPINFATHQQVVKNAVL